MHTSDYYFDLPPELIAQEPPPERGASRLLVVDRERGIFAHRCIEDLPEYLRAGDSLVVNDTRVFPARLHGVKEDSGGKVELLFIEPVGDGCWEALLRASRRPKAGAVLRMGKQQPFRVTLIEDLDLGKCKVQLEPDCDLIARLEAEGEIPLPPYIQRERDDPRSASDPERYQTVYARESGAVAAPTAGLHLTPELLESLQSEQKVNLARLTLHVGPGTFRPVKTEDLRDHYMEAERFSMEPASAELLNQTRANGGRIVAVGSTSVRTLETLYSRHQKFVAEEGRSSLFIYPGYEFQAVDMMLTNFHLPCSTLVMMVCALGGTELILEAYQEAIRNQYRFYSYGDAMLVI